MKCIKIIKDEDFDIVSKSFNNPRVRIGARGIVLNSEGKIAILTNISQYIFNKF